MTLFLSITERGQRLHRDRPASPWCSCIYLCTIYHIHFAGLQNGNKLIRYSDFLHFSKSYHKRQNFSIFAYLQYSFLREVANNLFLDNCKVGHCIVFLVDEPFTNPHLYDVMSVTTCRAGQRGGLDPGPGVGGS